MSDLISRQAAIDALVQAIREDPYYDSNEAINGLGVCDVRVILNDLPASNLPSAQPEIVRCKDCKYAAPNGVYGCRLERFSCSDDSVRMYGEDFCSYAERKDNDS